MSSKSESVRYISECSIKPKQKLEEHSKLLNLTPWDIVLLSVNYMQTGLLYQLIPGSDNNVASLLNQLKESLSVALVHFYPLAGQFHTQLSEPDENGGHTSLTFIDSTKGPGVKFIHAAVDLTISDLLSPTDAPCIVDSFFQPHRAVNHDGHHLPLLSVQITQLIDGIVIGCSMNHSCADGASFWHFLNSWSEIYMKKKKFLDNGEAAAIDPSAVNVLDILRPPIHTRWLLDGSEPIVKLPFEYPEKFIRPLNPHPPPLRNRIFHFSSESIRNIKSRANTDSSTTTISSLQALSALAWLCITRARKLPQDKQTTCWLLINNRKRLDPPLSDNYFGNCLQAVRATTIAGELIQQSLGGAALHLNKVVSSHNDKEIREYVARYMKTPFFIHDSEAVSGSSDVVVTDSPWFDMYGNEFGILRKPLAMLRGDTSKSDGKVIFAPGSEGDRSVDLEICLVPDSMKALEADEEFVGLVG